MSAFVEGRDVRQRDVTGRLYEGIGPAPHPGVLVFHGAGGGRGYEQEYARYLAAHGYTAFCVEYFGTPGTPDALARIPLSRFEGAIDWLTDRPDVSSGHVGAIGLSRGGEAALLVGARCERVGVVVGYVTSGLAFPAPTWMDGVEEEVAAWTVDGGPVPYIPVEESVETNEEGLEETIAQTDSADGSDAVGAATRSQRAQAAIEVERIDGPVLLISGGADEVWPSPALSSVAIERLDANNHPWPSEHRSFPDAGHAIRVPYRFDETSDPTARHRFGGTAETNAHASAAAWRATLDYLRRGLTAREEERDTQSR
ncbi:MAG: acyl-CoA thioester hydrolase/BAAT C-terminal domain-containing protein [Halobacteriaceae archaeon]